MELSLDFGGLCRLFQVGALWADPAPALHRQDGAALAHSLEGYSAGPRLRDSPRPELAFLSLAVAHGDQSPVTQAAER